MKSSQIIRVIFFAMILSRAPLDAWAQQVLSEPTPDSAQRAARLEQEGKLQEAREVYEALLKESAYPEKQAEELMRRYESLNRRILYTASPSADSVIHEVVKGDSLYKIAHRYKTTTGLIKRVNGLRTDTIYPGQKLKIENGTFRIRIDKSENILTLYYQDRPLKRYRVATGSGGSTPDGRFKIVNKLENPTWYRAGAVVPPDSPRNILGTRWMGFDLKSYGIHGTTEPDSIGKQVSAGCVRMLNKDVEEIYDLIPVGTEVIVVD